MSQLIVEICKIDNVFPHPNADRLDIAEIKGWHCIIQKNTFKAGDEVVYIPPDSQLTEKMIQDYNLEFVRNGGRVKSIKLRGYFSQGLVLENPKPNKFKLGDDVADYFGITKWEPPAPKYQFDYGKKTSKKVINPYFDKYCSPDNIKHYPNVFQDGDMVVITEKIHGTNWRAGMLLKTEKTLWAKLKKAVQKMVGRYNPYEFVYGSREVQITHNRKYKGFYGEDIYGRVAKKYNMKDIIPPDYIVYGEVYGEGIQDLTYGIPANDLELVIFDVKYNGRYLTYAEKKMFCEMKGLPFVPVLYVGEWQEGLLEAFTSGRSMICGKQIREGIMITDLNETNHPRIGRKILKSISPDYLTRDNATEYH